MRLARRLVGPTVPKSWDVWPISDPAVYPRPGGTRSWEGECGRTKYSNGRRKYLIVGFRHGFIDAVAAPMDRLRKVLPAICRIQPVQRVAVTGLRLEHEKFVAGGEWRQIGDERRVLLERANCIPPAVWERLTPPVTQGVGDSYRAYPTAEAAHVDLGRAMLCWARAEQL